MNYIWSFPPNGVEPGYWCGICERVVSKTVPIRDHNGNFKGVVCVECRSDWNYFSKMMIGNPRKK